MGAAGGGGGGGWRGGTDIQRIGTEVIPLEAHSTCRLISALSTSSARSAAARRAPPRDTAWLPPPVCPVTSDINLCSGTNAPAGASDAASAIAAASPTIGRGPGT